MPCFVKQTQLVRGSGPDLGQHGRVERRAVSDDLVRVDAGVAQALEKAFDRRSVHIAVDQLVADEPIAIRRRRVHREEESELTLIDFIDAEDA